MRWWWLWCLFGAKHWNVWNGVSQVALGSDDLACFVSEESSRQEPRRAEMAFTNLRPTLAGAPTADDEQHYLLIWRRIFDSHTWIRWVQLLSRDQYQRTKISSAFIQRFCSLRVVFVCWVRIWSVCDWTFDTFQNCKPISVLPSALKLWQCSYVWKIVWSRELIAIAV